MKKSLLIKTFVLLTGLLFQATIGWGQLLYENFDYPIGDYLTNHGWVAHSGAGTQPIDVTSGLNFTGYIGSGIGGAANVDNNGEDVNKKFSDSITTGVVYAAFMIQTQSTNSAGYFLHLSTKTLNTSYFISKVWVKADGTGVSISSSTAPTTWVAITPGISYLLVIKFDFTTKISSLFVFDSFPNQEPTNANVTFTETVTIQNVGCIALRQFNASQRIIVDGIRIATNWNDAVTPAGGPPTVATPTFNPLPGICENPVSVTISCSTPDASIYYTTDGSDPDQNSTLYTFPVNIASTTTLKARAYLEGYNPSNIATGIYTFRTPVSTIAELRAGTVGVPYILTGEVYVTYFQLWRNQIFIQDNTAAILIDDNTNTILTEYEIGDGFSGLKGSLTLYQGMLQFVPANDPGDPTGFQLFTPEVITIAQLNSNFEDYEAELVKILNVTFTAGGSTFNTGTPTVYEITDVSDATGSFRTSFLDADYLGTTIPVVPTTIIGICNSAGNPAGSYITSRWSSDIIPSAITPTIIVTRPDGGEYWQQGDTETIMWNNLNFTGNVTIQLIKPPLSIVPLATNIANTGSWDWQIPADQAIANNYKIRVKGVIAGDPSDDSDGYFSIVAPIGIPDIVINEIMYNSLEASDNEWIELYNMEAIPVYLEGFMIKDSTNANPVIIPAGYTIPAEGYFTIALNIGTPPLFFEPDVYIDAVWGLNNDKDHVKLFTPEGIMVDSVRYTDSAPWPTAADGSGPSLELIDPALDNSLPGSWLASLATNGTPGAQNSVYGFESLTIISPNGGEEYTQGSTQTISWSHVNFAGNLKIEIMTAADNREILAENIPVTDGTWNWEIPADYPVGTSYKIKISDMVDGNPMDESNGVFSIVSVIVPVITITSPNGGESWEQGSSHDITWTATSFNGDIKIELADGVSVITLIDVIAASAGTWLWNIPEGQVIGSNYSVLISEVATGVPSDQSDAPFSIVAPPVGSPNIVITEINYNPPESGTDTTEFIEIYNNGLTGVNLQGWKFTGVTYTFPEMNLGAGEYLVIAFKASAILNTFGVTALQWSGGGLSNDGELVELRDASNTLIDEVIYDDVAPWPVPPDGYGPSLVLCNPSSDNSLAANWSNCIELAAYNAAGTAIYATPGSGCTGDLAQTYLIPTGWSGVSSYMNPSNPAVATLFDPIDNSLVVLQDFSLLYLPALAVNTIGNWDAQTGYQTKMTAMRYFVFKGTYLTNKTIHLNKGWNGIPVISTCPVDAAALFGAVPEFYFAKEMGSDLVYWPAGGLFTLTMLMPGKAYFVKTTDAVDITFPECTTGPLKDQALSNSVQHIWNEVIPTGASHAIGFAESALSSLKPGDIIGAFAANGYCAGVTEATYGNAMIMAWADDAFTMAVDGFTEEETFTFKVFRPATGEVFDVTAVYDDNFTENGQFITNGISFVRELKLGATGLNNVSEQNFSIYPNPNHGQFMINATGDHLVEISNAQGQVVYTSAISGATSLELNDLPSGIYFVKLSDETSSAIHKLVIR